MKLLLVGNQNSGKTTIYNLLTGDVEKIGNWAGVTIDFKCNRIKNSNDYLVDLPGIYSLSPYSNDELCTINYLKKYDYDVIINVIDINLLERSLYLTFDLLTLNKNVIILLTHINKYNRNDIIMNKKILEDKLGIKVIDINDIKNNINSLFMNIKSINNNSYRHLSNNNIELIAYNRYKYIEDVIRNMHIKKNNSYIDNLVLNKIFGPFIFIFLMFFIYYFSMIIIGNYTNNYIFKVINIFSNKLIMLLKYLNVYDWLINLVVKGIINGVSILISFIPQLFFFFLLLEILKQSGYITRVSFLFDGLLNKIGLSGKSIIPFMVGMSCSVPGIMQSRIIENKVQRLKTIYLVPFIPCSAKIPIIMMISSYLRFDYLIIIIYVLSICVIIISLLILNKVFVIEKNNYIMELPSYKVPDFKYIFKEVINKLREFIIKIGSIIVISSIIIWIFIYNNHLLYIIGRGISYIFYPFLGNNNWILSLAILNGLISREEVVSFLSVITNNNLSIFSRKTILSFLIFNMYSIPCINSVSAIKNELGSYKKLLLCLLFQFVVAFILAVIAYRIESILW